MSVMISLSAYNITNTEIFIFHSYILKAFLMKDWRFFLYYMQKVISLQTFWVPPRHIKFLQVTVNTSKSYHVNNVPVFFRKEQFCLLWRGVIKT